MPIVPAGRAAGDSEIVGAFTDCVRVPLLGALFVSPLYVAVTVCVPTLSVVVGCEVAMPPDSVTAEPKFVPSIANCTVPLGDRPVTVPVKVTDWPYVDGLEPDATVVVLAAVLTACVNPVAVSLAALIGSPL
jgi:hypothetical protein